MKKLLLAIAMVSLPMFAQVSDTTAVTRWVTKALTKCPDSKVTVEEMQAPLMPANFKVYTVTQTSSDQACGGQKYLLYSPATGQILVGTVIPLPADSRPAEVRVTETSSNLLKADVKTIINPFPLPDGLKSLSIVKPTEWGPFSYHGFIDQGQHFLIITPRGNIKEDPAKVLRDSLQVAQNGVRRGKATSKVEIIELSDFQCPTCGRAHKVVEPMIEKALGKINYIRLDLPLFEHHPWALNAAMGARAINKIAPAKYWRYVNFVFGDQEAIDKQKFDDVLKHFCEDNEVDWKGVEKFYHDAKERSLLMEQVSRAFDNGIISTPTYIVNGQMIGYGPEGKFTIDTIKQAIASAK